MHPQSALLSKKNNLIMANMLRLATAPGNFETGIAGMRYHRRHTINESECNIIDPTVAIVVQGGKVTVFGSEECRYEKYDYIVAGVEMPARSHLTHATEDAPFLGVSLKLNRQLITRLISEMPPDTDSGRKYPSVGTARTDPGLYDAFYRLTDLQNAPEHAPLLAPLIIHEIHYRLLTGPYGKSLRMLNTLGSSSNQIVKAISWIKANFRQPLHIEELAKMVNMSLSSFHRHFKQVTTMSPLQFQKQLRLCEAKRLMVFEKQYASKACLAVGYESPTQFNREYKRMFGCSPHKDISRVHHRTAFRQTAS